MDASCHKSYQTFTFDNFIARYQKQLPSAALFELTLPWLVATRDFMLSGNDEVVVHCLFSKTDSSAIDGSATASSAINHELELTVAWPLIHNIKNEQLTLRSLSSFYSAVTEPIYLTENSASQFSDLLQYISKNTAWHSMEISAIAEDSDVALAISRFFKHHKVFSQTDNFYQDDLSGFAKYYQQLPSQLKNTVRRRTKKLIATHQYEVQIITTLAEFTVAFEGYQHIYQQSWKGEEFSFDFIEQVCQCAIKEDKLRFGLLSIDGEPAAAQLWFIQEHSASIFKLAYDSKYKEFSVGSLLSMALSEYVLEQDKVASIEFGMGSEPYKKYWLAEQRQRVSYQLFNQQHFLGKVAAFRYITLPKYKESLLSKLNKR